MKYCDMQIKLGSLSTELLLIEMKPTIIPKTYEKLITEADEKDRRYLLAYDELLD